MPNDRASADAIAPPSADSVLHFIYRKGGDGATLYEVDHGSWVGYWFGHEFELQGQRYFTGFGYKTSEKIEGDSDKPSVDVEDSVAISQATFQQQSKDGKSAWSLKQTDGYVGEFGANDKPPQVDPKRKAQSHKTQDGKLLLAVPMLTFVSGVSVSEFGMFLFDPLVSGDRQNRSWSYVGSVAAGEDNSAACDEGKVMPCVSSSGVLSFEEGKANTLPTLQVSLKGTVITSPGKTGELGPKDSLKYHYDEALGIYKL